MSCTICHCFAIPDSNPEVCPECFVKHFQNHVNVGIKDDAPLTKDQLVELYPFVKNEFDNYYFYLTDFDDLVSVDKRTHLCYVLDVSDTGSAMWIEWDDYVRSI